MLFTAFIVAVLRLFYIFYRTTRSIFNENIHEIIDKLEVCISFHSSLSKFFR